MSDEGRPNELPKRRDHQLLDKVLDGHKALDAGANALDAVSLQNAEAQKGKK